MALNGITLRVHFYTYSTEYESIRANKFLAPSLQHVCHIHKIMNDKSTDASQTKCIKAYVFACYYKSLLQNNFKWLSNNNNKAFHQTKTATVHSLLLVRNKIQHTCNIIVRKPADKVFS